MLRFLSSLGAHICTLKSTQSMGDFLYAFCVVLVTTHSSHLHVPLYQVISSSLLIHATFQPASVPTAALRMTVEFWETI